MKQIAGLILTGALALSVWGCTEPKETTAIGAATGGVIGAGLGAIVGNQTGDPAAGLAVGAVAGAGAGAAIGNAIQSQEERIRAQDELIARQEKALRVQNAEIEEMRRLHRESDGLALRSPQEAGRGDAGLEEEKPRILSRTLDAEAAQGAERGSYGWKEERIFDHNGDSARKTSGLQEQVQTAKSGAAKYQSSECAAAEREVKSAQAAAEAADRLFHYRRALRLCPDSPVYHNGLGELYLSLNRNKDAQFEFEEALRLDPSFGIAQDNIKLIQGSDGNSDESR